MRYLALLLLVSLAGCTYTTYLSGADEHGGTVNLVTGLSQDSAMEKAREHCRQYNLVARLGTMDRQSNSMTFVCQPAGVPVTERGGI